MNYLLGIVAAVALVLLVASLSPTFADAIRDAALKVTRLLPNGAANVTSTGLETGVQTAFGVPARTVDYLLSCPALTTGQQPNAKTLIYDILLSDDAAMGTPTTYIAAAVTQTGAGGVGCLAATFTFALPSNVGKKYVGFKATGSATGDSSAASATLEALA